MLKNNQNLKYLLSFSISHKITYQRYLKLKKYFKNDLEKAWYSAKTDWLKAGITEKTAEELSNLYKIINPQQELLKFKQAKIKYVCLEDINYPKLLKQIPNPPWIIYYLGSLACLNNPCLAVVGTRTPSDYGIKQVKDLTAEIIKNKITIVSGLARGIDTLAHLVCVQNNHPTVAVLGTDLISYNKKEMIRQIIKAKGLVVSQFPLYTPASKYTFPERNRLISGLSKGTLIIEAKKRSGALITAYQALDQNREVMAIPGNLTSDNSHGTNRLIQLGAKLILNSQDVIDCLNFN